MSLADVVNKEFSNPYAELEKKDDGWVLIKINDEAEKRRREERRTLFAPIATAGPSTDLVDRTSTSALGKRKMEEEGGKTGGGKRLEIRDRRELQELFAPVVGARVYREEEAKFRAKAEAEEEKTGAATKGWMSSDYGALSSKPQHQPLGEPRSC